MMMVFDIQTGASKALFRACAAGQTLRGVEDYFDVSRDGRFIVACLAPETKERAITVQVGQAVPPALIK